MNIYWQNGKKIKQQFQIFISAAGLERFAETRKTDIFIECCWSRSVSLYFSVPKSEETSNYENVILIIILIAEYFALKQNDVNNTLQKHLEIEDLTLDRTVDIYRMAELSIQIYSLDSKSTLHKKEQLSIEQL